MGGEVREKEKKKKRKGDSRDRSRDRSERKRESGDKKEKEREKEKKKRRKERDGDDDNKYNANVSVPTEEEIKKKSDALLDDLFIYMMREKYAKDVADKEKLKNSGRMGFFKSVGGERSRRERSRKVMKEEGSVSGSVASDDLEELRKIALKSIKVEPVKEEEMEVEKEEEKGTKCFNPALIQF